MADYSRDLTDGEVKLRQEWADLQKKFNTGGTNDVCTCKRCGAAVVGKFWGSHKNLDLHLDWHKKNGH